MIVLVPKLRGLLVAIALTPLAGCGMKLIDLGPTPNLYDISPEAQFAQQIPSVEWQLVVPEPSAATTLDTDRILVRPSDYEIKYFAEARWSERAPRLVQSQLVKAFDKSGSIVGVGREAIGLRGDYELQSELRAFDTVYSGGSTPRIVVSISFKLVREPATVIIASRAFEQQVRPRDVSLTSIAAAHEEAMSRVLTEVVPWVLSEAQKDYLAHRDTMRYRGVSAQPFPRTGGRPAPLPPRPIVAPAPPATPSTIMNAPKGVPAVAP